MRVSSALSIVALSIVGVGLAGSVLGGYGFNFWLPAIAGAIAAVPSVLALALALVLHRVRRGPSTVRALTMAAVAVACAVLAVLPAQVIMSRVW